MKRDSKRLEHGREKMAGENLYELCAQPVLELRTEQKLVGFDGFPPLQGKRH